MAIRPVAPGRRVLAAVVLCACSALVAAAIALAPPALGLRFTLGPTGPTPVLAAVAGPAADAGVRAGETVVSVGAPGAAPLALDARDLLEEPDLLDTWPESDAFFARQTALRALLDRDVVQLGVRDARGAVRPVTLRPAERPATALPLAFWLQLAFGAVGGIVGTWIWALRPGDRAARAFAATGACFVLFAHAAAAYSARELALDGTLFRALSGANHLGATMFGVALCALLLSYPRPLVRARWLGALAAIGLAWWLTNVTRLAPDQDWASRFPVLLAMLGAVAIAPVQWWRTRGDPASRAVLRWFAASVLVGCGLFVGLTAAVAAAGFTPVIPQGYAFGFFALMYVGLAVGLRRHRLFDLDAWALRVLGWAVVLVALVALDASLLATAGAGPARSFAVVLGLGVLSVPARRRVLALFGARGAPTPDRVVADGLHVAYADTDAERATRWRALLERLFAPLHVDADHDGAADRAPDGSAAADAARLEEGGLALVVPAAAGLPALRLTHAAAGRRLFHPRDVRLVETLVALLRTVAASRRAFEDGVRRERTRIARDLHDTVSSPLLAGLARPDAAGAAGVVHDEIRRAVDGMRAVVRGTEGAHAPPVPLADVLADVRYAAVERLTAHGLAVDWPLAPDATADVAVPADAAHALAAFHQEVVTNVLRHARATRLAAHVTVDADGVACRLADDGVGFAPDAVRRGQGLDNLAARAAALGGTATFAPGLDGRGTAVTLHLPPTALRAHAGRVGGASALGTSAFGASAFDDALAAPDVDAPADARADACADADAPPDAPRAASRPARRSA